MHHLSTRFILAAALGLGAATAQAGGPTVLVEFNGGIGVDPLTAAGGVDVVNTVRGVAPGGRAWIIRKLEASVFTDGTLRVKGKGVLLASGEGIATKGAVTHVAATLACGPADATALKASTVPIPLDTAGNFSFRGALSADGVNTVVLPATCDNPVLFIRNANATTGALGGWFAVGIPGSDDD